MIWQLIMARLKIPEQHLKLKSDSFLLEISIKLYATLDSVHKQLCELFNDSCAAQGLSQRKAGAESKQGWNGVFFCSFSRNICLCTLCIVHISGVPLKPYFLWLLFFAIHLYSVIYKAQCCFHLYGYVPQVNNAALQGHDCRYHSFRIYSSMAYEFPLPFDRKMWHLVYLNCLLHWDRPVCLTSAPQPLFILPLLHNWIVMRSLTRNRELLLRVKQSQVREIRLLHPIPTLKVRSMISLKMIVVMEMVALMMLIEHVINFFSKWQCPNELPCARLNWKRRI